MKETIISIIDYQNDYDDNEYEVWDEEKGKWVEFSKSCYTTHRVNAGFPNFQYCDKEVNAITVKLFGYKDVYVLGLTPYKTETPELLEMIDNGYKIHYKQCANEEELLYTFLMMWDKLEPDVVTGWNIRVFDIPYIIKRCQRYFSDEFIFKLLSPYGKVKSSTVTFFNRENDIFDIVGVPTMDYIDIFKKFSFGVEESYSLNYLSGKILNATKLDYSEYGSLANLQTQAPSIYLDYNIIDVIRVEQIDEQVNYMDIAFEIAYETLTNYVDSLTTIRVWDILIHNYLMDQNIVVPFATDNRKDRNIAGGYVKEVDARKHNWVMSFDFKSLYPNLSMTYNISPDTYLGTIKEIFGINSVESILNGALDKHLDQMIKNDVTVTGCGTVFTRKKRGFVPAIMDHFFSKRMEYQGMEEEKSKLLEQIREEKARRGI